jgi:hypothetical protein
MIPLGSRPAVHHVAEPYVAAGFDVLVAAHQQFESVAEYLHRVPFLRAHTLDVGPTRSIAETVATALHMLPRLPESLVINFADTLLSTVLNGDDVICYQERTDTFRWTTFRRGEDGCIQDVQSKDTLKLGSGPLPVFVGVFGFSDPKRFLEELDSSLVTASPFNDPFWTALSAYADRHRFEFLSIDDWKDLGHLDTYYASQRAFFLNARSFNTVAVDLGRGVIRKTSTNAKKLAKEIDWYLSLPRPLQHLGPRVFAYERDPTQTTVEMEFYGYPALNDVYLHGNWDPGVWSQALSAIGRAIDGMSEYRIQPESGRVKAALHDMYETKTIERVQPLLSEPRFAPLSGNTVRINGRDCFGLRSCLAMLPQALEYTGLYSRADLTIIHGDLCLSNVLYDRRSGFVRLIDPRGSFGGIDLYGDPVYDLAKLSHSLRGDYDFLVNDLFELDIDRGEVTLAAFRRRSHDVVRDLFRSWLGARVGDALRQVNVIESLLFLSMIPLHADRPRSQTAFLARGLELFTDAVHGLQTQPQTAFWSEPIANEYCHYDGR